MIRSCRENEQEVIRQIINDAAQAYKGVIPADCWSEPYMPQAELTDEIAAGVRFLGYEQSGDLVGVMGVQDVQDVTLIRHAYVSPTGTKESAANYWLGWPNKPKIRC